LIGRHQEFANHVRVQGAVGLPRAAACGSFATQLLHDEADHELQRLFSYDRKFLIPFSTKNMIAKAIVFGISNAKAMGTVL
jgi:hypothetical protein